MTDEGVSNLSSFVMQRTRSRQSIAMTDLFLKIPPIACMLGKKSFPRRTGMLAFYNST